MLRYFYPDKLPYEVWLGLDMNADMIELKWAAAVARGVGVAQKRGAIDRAYYDALCRHEDEVDETAARGNAERDLAAMRRER